MKNNEKIKYNRNSVLVKMGRIYQKYSQILSPVDALFQSLVKEKKDFPTIILLAPPRSGSTLAYQVITSGIRNFHLTNIWNLLHTTPTIGGLLSQKICKNYQSKFQSKHGFVSGLCGESEGLQFWSHWAGQGLTENKNHYTQKDKHLYKILKKIKKDKESFITGYLGHTLCINKLKKIFPKIIFIHLKRDLLSNAYSLFNLSNETWPSTKPKEILNYKKISKHRASIIQLLLIHQKILSQTNKNNIITINYHDLCENPKKVIEKVVNFAREKSFRISLKQKNNIPERFPESKIKPNLNEDTQKIQKYLEIEINKKEFSEVKKLFSK
jgi:hypothetical protein